MRRRSWRLSADGTLWYWWNESFFKEGTERLWGPLLCPSQSPKAAIISVTRQTQIACWTTYYKNWKVGGSGRGIHVTPWLIHVNVWQNPLQCCEVISLQLIKINEKKERKVDYSQTNPYPLPSPSHPSQKRIKCSSELSYSFLLLL